MGPDRWGEHIDWWTDLSAFSNTCRVGRLSGGSASDWSLGGRRPNRHVEEQRRRRDQPVLPGDGATHRRWWVALALEGQREQVERPLGPEVSPQTGPRGQGGDAERAVEAMPPPSNVGASTDCRVGEVSTEGPAQVSQPTGPRGQRGDAESSVEAMPPPSNVGASAERPVADGPDEGPLQLGQEPFRIKVRGGMGEQRVNKVLTSTARYGTLKAFENLFFFLI